MMTIDAVTGKVQQPKNLYDAVAQLPEVNSSMVRQLTFGVFLAERNLLEAQQQLAAAKLALKASLTDDWSEAELKKAGVLRFLK